MVWPTHIVAAGGIVEDGQGNILLVKTHQGGWVFPGGQVEVGENVIDGLIREVKEESGIDVEIVHLIGVYSNTQSYKWKDGITDVPTKLMLDFVCKPIGGHLCASDETSDSCWVAKDQVLNRITAPAYRTRYEAYLNFQGNVHYKEYVTREQFTLKLDRLI